jgi:hypothetical protein
MFFAVYIHPLAAVLAGSFCLCVAIFALAEKRFRLNLGAAAAGAGAGLFHWFYYLAFVPKPVAAGAWEDIGLVPFRLITKGWISEYVRNLKNIFRNIFNFELSYLEKMFFRGPWTSVVEILDRAAIVLGLFGLAAALVISFRALWPAMRRRRAIEPGMLPYLFFLVLFAAVLAKAFLFYPPHLEPRHNFDAVVLVMLSLFITGGAVLRFRRILSWKSLLVLAIGLVLAFPHILAYYYQALDKNRAYHELLDVLRENQVKVVDTDFILAYCLYFLSDRRLLAADGIGPFQVKNIYPELRHKVAEMPWDQKTFIFYSDRYPSANWHKKATKVLMSDLLNRMKKSGILYKIKKLRDYVLIIPERDSQRLPGIIK